jgi:hypothetical protein
LCIALSSSSITLTFVFSAGDAVCTAAGATDAVVVESAVVAGVVIARSVLRVRALTFDEYLRRGEIVDTVKKRVV